MDRAVLTRAYKARARELAPSPRRWLRPHSLRLLALALPLTLAAWLAGCGSAPQAAAPAAATAQGQVAPAPPPAAPSGAMEGARGSIVGQNASLAIYVPVAGDTLQGVATRVLGDPGRAWRIAEANGQNWAPAAGARRAGIVTVHALHSTARVCRVPGSAGRLRRAEAAYTRPGFRVPAWA